MEIMMKLTRTKLQEMISEILGEDAELTHEPGAERPKNVVDDAGAMLEEVANLTGLAFEPDVAAFIQELSIRLEEFPEIKAQFMTEEKIEE